MASTNSGVAMTVQFVIGGVEKDQAVLAEDAGVKAGVGVGERLTFAIALAQVVGGERIAQQLSRLLQHERSCLPQSE